MARAIAATTLLMVVAAASATLTARHELWSQGTLSDGTPYESFRLWVDITSTPGHTGEDDWTAAGLDAELTGGIFYQHPTGGWQPYPPFFCYYPDLEYDSYYASPGSYPNTTYDGSIAGVAATHDSETRLDTDWFDTVDTGNGDFVIAQLTVLPTDPDWIATGHLQYAARHTGGQLFDYFFTIPEPGTLALLAVCGLTLTRRR